MRRYLVPILSSVSLFLVMVTVLVNQNVTSTEAADDPFQTYASIMPGQPSSALGSFSCTPIPLTYHIPENWWMCQIRSPEEPIRQITITVEGDHISSISFKVKGLRFGQVVQRWGYPVFVHKRDRWYGAYWGQAMFVFARISNWFTYQSPVDVISIVDGQWHPD